MMSLLAIKISVIIPIYNVRQYLPCCLDSLIDQSYTNWEAVCVDDGSTDGSSQILEDYAKRDKRIIIVRQENSGVSVARNVGIRIAQGDWITFLDADDMYVSDWLLRAVELITETNPDLLRLRAVVFSDVAPEVETNMKYAIIDSTREILIWGWKSFTKEGWQWLLFQRRLDAIKYHFPPNVKYSEDSLRALSMIGSLKCVCQGEFGGYLYRNRIGSACKQRFRAAERINFLKQCKNLFKDPLCARMGANFIWNNIVVWGIMHEIDGREEELHYEFRQLVDNAGIKARFLKTHWRVPYIIYKQWGLISPILMVHHLLKALTYIRSRVR